MYSIKSNALLKARKELFLEFTGYKLNGVRSDRLIGKTRVAKGVYLPEKIGGE